jgi:hypothetical protein
MLQSLTDIRVKTRSPVLDDLFRAFTNDFYRIQTKGESSE